MAEAWSISGALSKRLTDRVYSQDEGSSCPRSGDAASHDSTSASVRMPRVQLRNPKALGAHTLLVTAMWQVFWLYLYCTFDYLATNTYIIFKSCLFAQSRHAAAARRTKSPYFTTRGIHNANDAHGRLQGSAQMYNWFPTFIGTVDDA